MSHDERAEPTLLEARRARVQTRVREFDPAQLEAFERWLAGEAAVLPQPGPLDPERLDANIRLLRKEVARLMQQRARIFAERHRQRMHSDCPDCES